MEAELGIFFLWEAKLNMTKKKFSSLTHLYHNSK